MPGLGFPLGGPLGGDPAPSGNFSVPVAGASVPQLGKGLLSPLREDPNTGGFQRVSDEANVRQCLRDGITTALGERPMSEGLGTIARDMLFEQSNIVADLVPPSVRDFIERWEPRAQLVSVRAQPVAEATDSVQFKVSVVYVVRATNARNNLVFPFYLVRQP